MPLAALASALAAAAAAAPDLPLPAPAALTAETAALDSTRIPTGPWDGAAVPLDAAEGRVTRRAWRLEAPGVPTLALLAPLRAALAAQGYAPGFACDAAACGGFDFRYALDLLPEPAMHVDLGDFRVLTATRGAERVLLVVSRSAQAGYVHLTHVGPAAPAPADAVLATKSPAAPAAAPDALGAALAAGPVTLDGLAFASGSADLAPGPMPALDALAAWLAANPAARVTVVGHTDASGDAVANVALSRRRAEAVRDRLIAAPGVSPEQVLAAGAGFAEPRATNATASGRAENRRVEVTLTPTPVQAP